MFKKLFLSLLLSGTAAFAQTEKPKLVVGIVVDQMRTDYLYRYYNDYQEGGFKRMLSQGFVFRNTHYNYMPTYTAPGHASIYTGAVPAVHGIVGNSWYHKGEAAQVYVTTDPEVFGIGIDSVDYAGQMSPIRLKSTTITDELKMDTNFRGKVIGISIKDRGAILPAGHFGDAAYWMDGDGNFISSNFYMKQLPQWITDFNAKDLAGKYIDEGWDLLLPAEAYDESTEDNTRYERVFRPKTAPVFPYNLREIADVSGGNEIIKSTPHGNTILNELGKSAVINEDLGVDEFTDFLAISYSSPDYVGHNFGPRSMETQDTYLRLDRDLADLFSFLDERIGADNYLVFLTADHAAAENPNYLFDRKYYVRSLDSSDMETLINGLLEEEFGENLFVNYSNQNIYLDEGLIKESKLNYEDIVHRIKAVLEQERYIKRVYTRDEILKGNPVNYHLNLIARGFDPKQNGDLVVVLDPQFMEYSHYGTTHGSSYNYDTHVPNIWMGWGIEPGTSAKRYEITNIAPTLSILLNIPIPNGSEGVVLEEILD